MKGKDRKQYGSGGSQTALPTRTLLEPFVGRLERCLYERDAEVGTAPKRPSDWPSLIDKHRQGDQRLGIFVTLPRELCRVGVLDLDAHDPRVADRHAQAVTFHEALDENGYLAYHVTSRGGRGAHIWLFFDDPGVPARDLHAQLQQWADELRAKGPVDVFPRSAGGDGGAVFLPYFGDDNDLRDVDGLPVPWDRLEANPPGLIPGSAPGDWPLRKWKLRRSGPAGKGDEFRQVLDEGAQAGRVFYVGHRPQAHRGYRNRIAGAVANQIVREGGSFRDFEVWDARNLPPLALDEPKQLRQWWDWAMQKCQLG